MAAEVRRCLRIIVRRRAVTRPTSAAAPSTIPTIAPGDKRFLDGPTVQPNMYTPNIVRVSCTIFFLFFHIILIWQQVNFTKLLVERILISCKSEGEEIPIFQSQSDSAKRGDVIPWCQICPRPQARTYI
jgi:hypothetical protein